MPSGPGPGGPGSWYDDFLGNKLSSKWVATRYSSGGQNDGVWTRDVKDSKVHWNATSGGSETGYWGEYLTLPVNAPGDIIVESVIRQKRTTANFGVIGVGINQGILWYNTRYGCELNLAGAGTNNRFGRNNTGATPFPGFPSSSQQPADVDVIDKLRIIRKNNYIFLYHDNLYVGQYAFASTVTDVNIHTVWYQAQTGAEKWVDYISVTPGSVIL